MSSTKGRLFSLGLNELMAPSHYLKQYWGIVKETSEKTYWYSETYQ